MKYYSFPLGLGFGTLNPPSTTLLSLEEYLYLYSNKSHHFLNHPIFFNNVFVGPFLKFHYIYIVIVIGPNVCDINFNPQILGNISPLLTTLIGVPLMPRAILTNHSLYYLFLAYEEYGYLVINRFSLKKLSKFQMFTQSSIMKWNTIIMLLTLLNQKIKTLK